MIDLIKEAFDFYAFFMKTSERERRLVIYAENRNHYPCFEGLINELLDRGENLCYVTSDPGDPVLKQDRNGVKVFYINILLALFFQRVDCRVFIMTLTDLNRYHLKRSVNKNVHYLYIFHAMVSTHMLYLEGAFDHYDSILCTGMYQIDELRKHFAAKGLPKKQLLEAGYYRLERIYDRFKRLQQDPRAAGDCTTVLIAPSWGDKNILESCGKELIKMLIECGYRVIVRPHPETTKRSPALIRKLEADYGAEPLVTFELNVSSDDSLLKSDVMICDCSGVALEYAFGTERPVLFLDVPKKIRNHEYQKLGIEPFELSVRDQVGRILDPADLKAVPDAIGELLADEDEYRKRIAAIRERSVFNFRSSSQAGARHVQRLLTD